MRFSKRPESEHEIALAMGTAICNCACDCSSLVCNCPSIPTHQIQYDQTAQGMTSTTQQSSMAGSVAA